MKKEIKFRAWDKKKNKWANPNDLGDLKGELQERARWDATDGCFYLFSVDDFIWMQYTGLKDKNDKEIYEGDILQDERKVNLVVSWCEHEYDGEVDGLGWNIGTPEKYYEIIGNIFENPELLKKD